MSQHYILLSLLGLASALSTPFGYTHKPADLPHPNPTRSFWVHSPGANPLAHEGSKGALTEDADVCIIGSGITGVSAAYYLAKAVEKVKVDAQKIRAVIFEAREFCSGATGGNLTPDALRHYEIGYYSATEMARIAREAGWSGSVDLVEGGHMDVILTEDRLSEHKTDFDSTISAAKSVNVSWLDREEMNAAYGTYNWGVRSPGYNLWPLKPATQLFEQSHRTTPQLQLQLHTHTAVTSISPHADSDSDASHSASARRWILTTPRGPVRCSSVLHAANAYASHLLPQLAGPAGILPVRGQVVALCAAMPLSVLRTTSWDTSVNPNPLVILGGARNAAGPPFEKDMTDDSAVNANVGRVLRHFLPQISPSLYAPNREPEAEWLIVHRHRVSWASTRYSLRQFIAAGYTEHGTARAVVVQMIMDELAGRESTPLPEWFPRAFLTWVRDSGAPADEPESNLN
ncbi:FAD dependent oxidoreductase-domain-containing protein [Mycena galopus ATCC 62051]|nr:FAD dependent oxidoreductase-domain-containing protein [Mycena galopus ATCC 62051]